MTLAPSAFTPARLSFSPRAEPLRLRIAEPHVYAYGWRHQSPTAVLVLIHGMQSHAQWFAETAELLLERGLSVYVVDRRGSGSSQGVRGDIQSFAEWYDEVVDVIERAAAEHPGTPVHLVGHCFGANVALGCLLTRQPAVKSLVMLTPGLSLLPDYTLLDKARILLCAFMAPQTRFPVPQRDELFTRDPDVLAWIRSDTLGAKTLTARCIWQVNLMLRELLRKVGSLRVPLLVLDASRDRISDNARNRAMLTDALGDRCSWQAFDAEHFLETEPCLDQVIEAIVNWVARQQEEAAC